MTNAMDANQERLILVHGTFANRSRYEGTSWWQLGSSTAEEIQSRLPNDVELPKVGEVFHWSGENSERERLKAAGELVVYLRKLESQGIHYHLIGHSHGGSVIWQALRKSVLDNYPLIALRSWATVGTPFLHLRTRSGNALMLTLNVLLAVLLLKPAYSTSLKLIKIFVAPKSAPWLNETSVRSIEDITPWNTPVLWIMKTMGKPIEKTPTGIKIGQFTSDEPITAWDLFSHDEGWIMLGTALLVLYVLLNVIVFLISPLIESIRLRAEHQLEDDTFSIYGNRWLGLWSPDDEAINGLRATLGLSVSFVSRLMIREPVLLSDYLMIVSRPYYWLLTPLFNSGLRPVLDQFVRAIVIKKAQGNNRPAAEVIRVATTPLQWDEKETHPPIPDFLNKQIVERANQYASGAAATFRNLLAAPSFAAGLENLGTQISGSELVHTSYFDHDEILDILTMHIAWSQTRPHWYRYSKLRNPEIVKWLVDVKHQFGADIALPDTYHFYAQPTVPFQGKIKPRRRWFAKAA